MTTEVQKLVVHYVDKKDEKIEIHLRNDEMIVNDKVNIFIEQLHHAYNGKPGKGFCGFSGEKNSTVATAMQSYRMGDLHFWNMTEQATEVLKEELEDYGGEYQLFDEGDWAVEEVVFKNGDIIEIKIIIDDNEYVLSNS